VVHEHYTGFVVGMGDGQFVTVDHLMKNGKEWRAARRHFNTPLAMLSGFTVYDMHILSDREEDKHYLLANGEIAHNKTF
jgi:hypothetical protein